MPFSEEDVTCSNCFAAQSLCEECLAQYRGDQKVMQCPDCRKEIPERKQPITGVCGTSEKHRSHHSGPTDKAVEGLKADILSKLRGLLQDLHILKETREECQSLEEIIKDEKQNVEKLLRQKFEKLHQFLREEEEASITALREEKMEISEETKNRIQTFTCDISDSSEQTNTQQPEMEGFTLLVVEVKSKLLALLQSLQIPNKSTEECQELGENIKDEKQNLEKMLRQEFESLHQWLREEEEAKINALKDAEEDIHKKRKERINTLSEYIVNLSSAIETINQHLDENGTTSLEKYTSNPYKPMNYRPPKPEILEIDKVKNLGFPSLSLRANICKLLHKPCGVDEPEKRVVCGAKAACA